MELRPTRVANRQPLRLPTVHHQLTRQTVVNDDSELKIKEILAPDARRGNSFCTVSASGQQQDGVSLLS